MITFLVAQATYNEIQIKLCKDSLTQAKATVPKTKASALLITTINNLLENHNLTYSDLNFIGINQGPAPFTTLRTLISTINGIAFATNIPLVGIDGLKTFFRATQDEKHPQTVVLLNAYNKEVYYAYEQNNKIVTGYENAEKLFKKIKEIMPTKTIRFLGNGVTLLRETMENTFQNRSYLPEPMTEFTSIDSIANAALEKFKDGKTKKQLLPLYLKTIKVNG